MLNNIIEGHCDNIVLYYNNTGEGTVSPGVSAALAIIVIIAVGLAVALVVVIVVISVRRRKKNGNHEAC